MLELNAIFNRDDVATDSEANTAILQNLTDPITNQLNEQHSFSVSNASYKLRSGMSWIKQKELKNRASTNIQASYDRLLSRKICTNEGVMQYLNSFSGERTE